ncbi:MAG: cell division protein SepF [Defluviitaleaceae bacterium]|nr:cell division protein SepF [Defluviitaleaceae bacterium]MCL2239121.1 cell division protein SepF [Defluviitaleaceae bacterium]
MREFWMSTKNWLREKMLSPGFDNYDPENPEGAYEYEEEPMVERAETWQTHAQAAIAPKPAKKNRFSDKYVELYGSKSPSDKAGMHVTLTSPKDVSNSNIVTDNIKDGKICAVNLTGVDREQAQRIVDVIAGAVYALDGSIQRVSKDVFIVAPEGVPITGEMKEELTRGFPWAASR